MKTTRLSFLVTVALAIGGPLAASANAAEQRRPNILFIMSDDHTTQAIGAYGGRLAGLDPTPNIDALARSGMRFTRAFANNSICTPSRASIITGQYPSEMGFSISTARSLPRSSFSPWSSGRRVTRPR